MIGSDVPEPKPGDRVEYIAAPVFDGVIDTGEIGLVTKVENGWVFAMWPDSGVHSVPLTNVRIAPRPACRQLSRSDVNKQIWSLFDHSRAELDEEQLAGRDPYLHEGSHPDIVTRIWDELGTLLPADCRAQADGTPVLAHPATDRIFAIAHGTAYAIWLTREDFQSALSVGATTLHQWSGGSATDLSVVAGEGWIWGRWYAAEPEWLPHSFDASGRAGVSHPPEGAQQP